MQDTYAMELIEVLREIVSELQQIKIEIAKLRDKVQSPER